MPVQTQNRDKKPQKDSGTFIVMHNQKVVVSDGAIIYIYAHFLGAIVLSYLSLALLIEENS